MSQFREKVRCNINHIHSIHPNSKHCLPLCFNIPCIPPLSDPLNAAVSHHNSQHSFYCSWTDIGQYLANVGFGDGSKAIQNSGFHASFLCDFLSMDNSKAFIKFLIAYIKRRKEILYKREIAVFVFGPAFGRLPQGFIVVCFIVVDLFLERNILSCVIAIFIK